MKLYHVALSTNVADLEDQTLLDCYGSYFAQFLIRDPNQIRSMCAKMLHEGKKRIPPYGCTNIVGGLCGGHEVEEGTALTKVGGNG